MGFKFDIHEINESQMISLSGSLVDKNQASELMDEIDYLLGNGVVNFVIDLSGVEFMNSSGLGILINILTVTRNKGGEAVITNVPEKINKLLIMTKLNTVFQVTENEEEAFDLLHSPRETIDQ